MKCILICCIEYYILDTVLLDYAKARNNKYPHFCYLVIFVEIT